MQRPEPMPAQLPVPMHEMPIPVPIHIPMPIPMPMPIPIEEPVPLQIPMHHQDMIYNCLTIIENVCLSNGYNISRIIRDFQQFLSNHNTSSRLRDVLNGPHEAWYFGNYIHAIIFMVFLPHTYHTFKETCQEEYLAQEQAHDALITLYDFLIVHGLDTQFKDCFENTPDNALSIILNMSQSQLPEHLLHYARSFKHLLSNGPQLKDKHLAIVRKWRAIVQKRKTRAVSVIENWWLEIKFSPYTEIGSRTIAKMSNDFKSRIEYM